MLRNLWRGSEQDSADRPAANPSGITETERVKIQGIWNQTALPRAEFDLTYGQLIDHAVNYFEHGPLDGWPPSPFGDARDAMFRIMFAALKIRQARIMPRGVPAEEAARLSEVMSYVVAVAVVLEQVAAVAGTVELALPADGPNWSPADGPCPPGAKIRGRRRVPVSFGLLLFSHLVPREGKDWLFQEEAAVSALLHYFVQPTASDVHDVIRVAKAKAFPAIADQVAPAAAAAPAATGESGTVAVEAVKELPKGWRCLHWLKAAIAAGDVRINEEDSFIHTLPGGSVFLASPAAFEGFAAEIDATASNVENSVLRLKLHKLRDGSRTRFAATLESGKRVEGLVIRDAEVVTGKPLPSPSGFLKVRFS